MQPGPAANVDPTAIIPESPTIALNVADIRAIGYTLQPEGATSTVLFASSDTAVLRIDGATGMMSAAKKGTATVSMWTANGMRATATVVVTDANPPKKVSFPNKSYSIALGTSQQLFPVLSPSTAVSMFTWRTYSSKIASVDANGVVTANKVGKTTVRATASNGKYGNVTIYVYDPRVPQSVSIDGASTLRLPIQDTTTRLTATVAPATAVTTVSWSVRSTKYATIDSTGLITPKRTGTTYVTAKTSNGKTDRVKLVIYDPFAPTKVTLSATGTVDVPINTTYQLTATVNPVGATQDVTWSSSSSRYAKVSSTGLVTAVKTGTVTITAKAYNGKYARVKIRVYDPRLPLSLTITNYGSKLTADLYDDTLQLNVSLLPASASPYTQVLYKSSKTSVATVSSTGKITPVGSGRTTITVYTKNAYTRTVKKDTLALTIKDLYAPSGITLDQGSSLVMDMHEIKQLTYTLRPATARAKVTFISSNKKVATVADDGTLTPVSAGSTVITVRTHNKKSDTIRVTVTDTSAPSAVSLGTDKQATMFTDVATKQLTATLTPDTAKANLTWASSNQAVATIDQNGLVTQHAEGTTYITVRTHNNKTDTLMLTVVNPTRPKSAVLYNAATGADLGSSLLWDHALDGALKLGVRVASQGGAAYPANTGTITWVSSSPSVATIGADGAVTYVGNGTTQITAYTQYGSVSATVGVTFSTYIPVTSLTIASSNTTLLVGGTSTVSVSAQPAGALPAAELVYASNNTAVATVSSAGLVTAVGAGYASITCTDKKTGVVSNSLTFTCSYPPQYRALILSASADKAVINSNNGTEYNVTWQRSADIKNLRGLLSIQNFGGSKYSITAKHNPSKAEVASSINALATASKDSDVTCVAVLAEGADNGNILLGNTTVTAAEFAAMLNAIKGRVIVFMANDYSGYYITEASGTNGAAVVQSNTSSGFNSAFTGAFRAKQSTVTIYPIDKNGDPILPPTELSGDGAGTGANMGELRQSKFYVLTATTALEETFFSANVSSWNEATKTATLNEAATFDYFVRGLCNAGGYSVSSGGALWTGRMVTLQQAYSTAASYVKTAESNSPSTGYRYSNVMVYPTNSSYVIFQH